MDASCANRGGVVGRPGSLDYEHARNKDTPCPTDRQAGSPRRPQDAHDAKQGQRETKQDTSEPVLQLPRRVHARPRRPAISLHGTLLGGCLVSRRRGKRPRRWRRGEAAGAGGRSPRPSHRWRAAPCCRVRCWLSAPLVIVPGSCNAGSWRWASGTVNDKQRRAHAEARAASGMMISSCQFITP